MVKWSDTRLITKPVHITPFEIISGENVRTEPKSAIVSTDGFFKIRLGNRRFPTCLQVLTALG